MLRPLLGLRSFMVKKGMDRETAVQYRDAIRQTGFMCVIEPEIDAQAGAIAAQPPAPATADERSAPAVDRPAEAAVAAPRHKSRVALALVLAAVAAGARIYFYPNTIDLHWSTISSNASIVGKWNCWRANTDKSANSTVMVFGNDGRFLMTSSMSYEIQYLGVYQLTQLICR